LTDVRIQRLPIAASVWEPVQPWTVVAHAAGGRLALTSAQPVYESAGTPAGGLDLETVYVGTGSDADVAGRDVRDKAAIIYRVPFPESRLAPLARLNDRSIARCRSATEHPRDRSTGARYSARPRYFDAVEATIKRLQTNGGEP
jgi:hypothetical protein